MFDSKTGHKRYAGQNYNFVILSLTRGKMLLHFANLSFLRAK